MRVRFLILAAALAGTTALATLLAPPLPAEEVGAPKPASSAVAAATANAEPFATGKVIFRQTEIEKEIRAALEKKWDDTKFKDTELRDVADFVKEMYKIPVELDRPALLADGKDTTTSITADIATGTTLRRALNSAFASYGLTYVIADDRILITTRSAAESDDYSRVRVYQVHDLVNPARPVNDFHKLTELITGQIAAHTWRDAGGVQGELRPFVADGVMALVVTHSEPVHDRIEELLTDLRAVRDAKVREMQKRYPLVPGTTHAEFFTNAGLGLYLDHKPPPLPPQSQELVAAGNRFGFGLYRKLAQNRIESANLIVSPIGIVSALGLAYAGSAGETAAEFRQALGVSTPDKFNPQLADLTRWFNEGLSRSGNKVSSRTNLFVKPDIRLTTSFVDTARRYFDVTPAPLDFSGIEARLRATGSLYSHREFVDVDMIVRSIGPDTRLAVVNTISFQGRWARPFSVIDTTSQPFHTPERPARVMMMKTTDDLEYAETDELQIVRNCYDAAADSGVISMYVLLPADKPEAFAKLEASLTNERFDGWLRALSSQKVHLDLPRFTFESLVIPDQPLQELGLKQAYTNQADFSGIDGERDLLLKTVRQKARIEVTEIETRATATTIAGGGLGGAIEAPHVPITMRCDRPFVFLIRDDTTGAILFIGRLYDPSFLE